MTTITAFPQMAFGPTDIPKWIFYFSAGAQWLRTYEIVRDLKNADRNPDWLYYVEPHALYFAIELFVKAFAAKQNPNFNARADKNANGKRIGHSATSIIEEYRARVPTFDVIAKNQRLFNLIKTYEGTLNTRFGETAVSMEGSDTTLLFDTAESLWNEIETTRKS